MAALELKHVPFDTFKGVSGTEANIDTLRQKLEASGIGGILVGGCVDNSKPFPRKDIDVVLSGSVDRGQMEGYDAWLHLGDRTENIRGVKLFNSLGTLALALGNLPPGLHVLADYYPNIRQNLPVTSYASIADLVKGDSGDLLDEYRGKPVVFSAQGRHYIGRLIKYDMWHAEFDDLVDIGEQDDRDSKAEDKATENAEFVANQFLGRELGHLVKVFERHIRAEIQARNSEPLDSDSVYIHSGDKVYYLGRILLEYGGRDGFDYVIPRALLERYGVGQLEKIIMAEVGKPYTSEDINQAVQLAKQKLGKVIYYHDGQHIPFFSVNAEEYIERYRNIVFDRIDSEFVPSRTIEIDGNRLSVTIHINRIINVPESISTEIAQLKRKLIDHTFLPVDSPDFFRQYNLLHQINLLPFFDGYVGNYVFARQAIVNLTDSPPLIRN